MRWLFVGLRGEARPPGPRESARILEDWVRIRKANIGAAPARAATTDFSG